MDSPDEKARKLQELKKAVEKGMADVEAGRVKPWDFEDFLRRSREQMNRPK